MPDQRDGKRSTRRPKLRRGDQIGNYTIEGHLGSGAQADVYLARDIVLRRPAAVKALRAEGAWLGRQVDEARVVATLDHPNVVRIYHVEVSSRTCYMAMEYVDGGSIDERVERKGPFGLTDAIELALSTAEALHHAHQRGVVHRDLKPKNILLTQAGIVKLADFGLALLSTTDAKFGNEALLAGTPQYMAPEVWDGKVATTASDVYGLGGCLLFMLTGQPPFPARTIQELRISHASQAVVVPEDIPDSIADLIRRCMSKRPHERPDAPLFYDEAQAVFTELSGRSHLPALLMSERSVGSGLESQASRGGSRGDAILQRSRAAFEHALWSIQSFVSARTQIEASIEGHTDLLLVHGSPGRSGAVIRAALADTADTAHVGARVDLLSGPDGLLEALAATGRVNLQAEPQPAVAILSHLKKKRLAQRIGQERSIAAIFSQQPLTTRDLTDIIGLLEYSHEYDVTILVSCDRSAAESLDRAVTNSGIRAHTERVELLPASESDLVRYLQEWTRLTSDNGVRWTRDAVAMALDYERVHPGQIDRVIHNAVLIAAEIKLKLVTTWCVAGATHHENMLQRTSEIEARWQARAETWPSPQLMETLPGLRRRYHGVLAEVGV